MEEIIVQNLKMLEAEFPAYAAEVIAWRIFQNSITLVVGLIMIVSSSVCLRWVWSRRGDDTMRPETAIPLLLLSFVLMIGFIVFVGSSEGLIKAHVAPRLVIIESLKQQIRN